MKTSTLDNSSSFVESNSGGVIPTLPQLDIVVLLLSVDLGNNYVTKQHNLLHRYFTKNILEEMSRMIRRPFLPSPHILWNPYLASSGTSAECPLLGETAELR
jgi:hypothetical protein